MAIPTNEDVLALLDRLDDAVADDLESLWLEFKPWEGPKESMRTAAEYAICMANSEGGAIVIGVADRVKGRTNAIHGASGYALDTWRRGIHDSTRPSLTVDVEELPVPEGTGKLLVVRVPKGTSPPYGTRQGLFKKRVGKSCLPMDRESFLRAQVGSGAIDWSGQTAEGVSLADLDPVEIARARSILSRLDPSAALLKLDDRGFLVGLGAVRGGHVTHAGLLLLGREELLVERCPQHQLHYVHQPSATEISRNDSYRFGLLHVLTRLEEIFTGPANPEQEVSIGFFKLRIPAFPVEVVREAVLNAVTHRDYSVPGEVLIRHTPRELVVTSPGGFLADITPRNILRAEPVSRNQVLAEAFQKLRLVERAGIGRHRIFIPMLSFGKQIPVYETDGTRVILRLFDGSFDERMARLVAKWRTEGREIDLDELLALSFLRQNAFLDSASASELLQLPREKARAVLDHLSQPQTGILERRGKTKAASYHLTKGVSNDLLGKAAYTRAKGLDRVRYPEMVRAFLRDHGSITPKECRELLGLSESPSARTEVSRYLARWAEEGGFLRREGNTRRVRYYLRPDC